MSRIESLLTKIHWREDTTANWEAVNPVLGDCEPSVEITPTNERKYKIGDGVNRWRDLPYLSSGVVDGGVNIERIDLDSLNFQSADSDLRRDINGNWSYRTTDGQERVIPGQISIPEQPQPEQLNLIDSSDIIVKKEDGNTSLNFTEDFKKDFNYLNKQSQVFIEKFDTYSEFRSALEEFMTTEGLEILGFKIDVLRDLNVAFSNWKFSLEGGSTTGTVTKASKTFKILDGNTTIVSFDFKYNEDKHTVSINATDADCPVIIKLSTLENTYAYVTPRYIAQQDADGNLNIPAVNIAPGVGSGDAVIADDSTANGLNNTFKISIIGMDKSGIMKK